MLILQLWLKLIQQTAAQFETLRREIEGGDFRPVYILMGEEPFYPERLCALITDRALQPHERDFNQTILYGAAAVLRQEYGQTDILL